MSSPTTSPRVLVIIPARYASTRFPGKPLVDIAGRPMIIRVVERALSVCSDVVVATDDERIRSVVEQYGYRAVMTSADLSSGTERCLEAYRLLGAEADVLVNLQGDEPFIADEQIRLLISAFVEDETTDIATLAQPFSSDTTNEELANPNAVKLVRATSGQALYFSRSVIPYLRGVEGAWASQHQYLKHIFLDYFPLFLRYFSFAFFILFLASFKTSLSFIYFSAFFINSRASSNLFRISAIYAELK